ncbi:MAG: TPM domain-containing protein [Aromatoleum sp.]|uniref:TPM domain-containing protein n=1 Tax=Aromatoleum sp. TaxID=2307007 RepID=UPI002893EAF2|nr:TPM domain-containing protein [Aromatoleum sp.]MDT3671703.1 TPM domain-containing protein [Aromatoleum sp.]
MRAVLQRMRHFWLDARDAERTLGPGTLDRIEARIRESEQRHRGEICVCVEASLPTSYLWRHLRQRIPMEQVVHERALMLFSKLRVWDTELNNGVLIYLQLAEQRIEIVDDRGLARYVPDAEWEKTLAGMSARFGEGRYEDGLTRAVDAVTAALERHFPADTGEGRPRENQLPDRPVIR